MSLNWNIEKCSPAAKADENWEATDSLIWATIAVDLGELTEKNLKEWKVRLKMWENTTSPPGLFATLLKLTPEQWAMRFGLNTNVTSTSRAAFKRKVANYVEREAEAALRPDPRKKEGA